MAGSQDARASDAQGRTATCVTVFRTRLRPEHLADYGATALRMESLAAGMPGFLSFKTFAADDGERVSIVEFASLEASAAWRDHAEHREAQRRARESFYSEYRIQVCECVRDGSFSVEARE